MSDLPAKMNDPQTGQFVKRNPGNKNGSKHRVTIAVENLLEGEAEKITRVCIELAKAGEPTALKLVMERIAPVRKGRPLTGVTRREGEHSVETLLRAVLDGEMTPEEGKDVVGLIEAAARVAAAKAIAELREQQLALMRKRPGGGSGPSGVLLVPMVEGGLDTWEAMAEEQQRDLKRRVRD